LRELVTIQDELHLDVFFPSIHVLDERVAYVSYWPDCQPKHFPEFFNDEHQRIRDGMISGLLETGNPLIINSRDAKSDMVRFYGAQPESVFDLPFAPILNIEDYSPRPELVASELLSCPFFLVSNQFWIHKSIETVLRAANFLKQKAMDVRVVFTGKMEEPRKPEYITYILELIDSLALHDHILYLGYIPKRTQIEIMKSAVAVIQSSLFEGGPGGGSVYDAHALGVRCIVTDIPVNRELPINGLVSFFPPRDHETLALLMEAALLTPYKLPPFEDCYERSRMLAQELGKRLAEVLREAQRRHKIRRQSSTTVRTESNDKAQTTSLG
jgi:glycosyltransferase involved in cell wall biosynthesis